jgi:hypothetical protein
VIQARPRFHKCLSSFALTARTIPKKGEYVWVVLDDEGAIDRMWLMN